MSATPTTRIARFTSAAGRKIVAAFEQPVVVRYTHWISAITIPILIASGVQILFAFPSFGPKIPQHNLINVPQQFHPLSIGSWFHAIALGRWLAGAEQWHFAFMWIFIATGVIYVAYEIISGHYKTVLFLPRDVPGVWPVVKHYFLFGKKPAQTQQYNPLQKLAYTATVFFGAVSLLSGLVKRLSLCPHLAFHCHVWVSRFYSRSPHHGRHPRVAQLHVDADWLEKTSEVPFRITI